jgi:hypothetical protein
MQGNPYLQPRRLLIRNCEAQNHIAAVQQLSTYNMAKRITKLTQSDTPSGTTSERAAFAALLAQTEVLKIAEVYQCDGVFADGYLVDNNCRKIPVEMKETLGWPQLTSACFQLVSLNNLESLHATEAWIVYEKISTEWKNRHNEAAIQHANECVGSFKVGLDIKFMQLLPTGEFIHTGGVKNTA